jgi:hypothetical protein
MHYKEDATIFVPEWVNIMTTGGIFEKEVTCRGVMEEQNFKGDIRLFKVAVITKWLRTAIEFRTKQGYN